MLYRWPSLRRLLICCPFAIALCAPPIVPAQAPATAPATLPVSAADIETLIADLSSDSWAVRQKAQSDLVQIGPDAVPRLKQLLAQTNDEEVRTRAEAALKQIAEIRYTGPSFITLRLKNAPPQLVFAELARQADADLLPSPHNLWESRPWPSLDIDIQQQPFWRAMRIICDKFAVSPQTNNFSRDLLIADRQVAGLPWGSAPSVLSGPFLLSATRINSYRTVDLNQPDNVIRNCHIQFQVYAEPKVRVLQGSYSPRIDLAIDEKGNSLIAARPVNDMMQPFNNWAWNLSVSLSPPPDAGQRIAKLKGNARCVIQTRAEQAEIPNVLTARNVTRLVGGRKFLLKEVRRNAQMYTVLMNLARTPADGPAWMHPFGSFMLLDGHGNPLQRMNTGGVAGALGDVSLLFQAQNPQDLQPLQPAKLVWEVPLESKEIQIPFEFVDLPLP